MKILSKCDPNIIQLQTKIRSSGQILVKEYVRYLKEISHNPKDYVRNLKKLDSYPILKSIITNPNFTKL